LMMCFPLTAQLNIIMIIRGLLFSKFSAISVNVFV
jgi:hypothetical protein